MSASTLEIAPAVPDDVPQILRFVRDLAAYERATEQVFATEALLREALFGPQPAAEVVLARLDGVPVGFALFFHNFSTWLGRRGLWLEDLYVDPAARGQGVGRALLEHLAGVAVERGCWRLDWNVLDWNAGAVGFYRELGAEPLNEWTMFRLAGESLARLARRGDH